MENDKTFLDDENYGMTPQEGEMMQEEAPKKESKKIGVGAAAGIGVGAAVAGAAAAAIPFFAFAHDDNTPVQQTTTGTQTSETNTGAEEEVTTDNVTADQASSSHVAVASDLTVAVNVNDDMSFAEAFAAARAEVGPGGIFYYHGNAYGTYYETEWNNMSADERADYWASVNHTMAAHPGPTPPDENLVTHFTDDDILGAGLSDVYLVNANNNDDPDVIVDLDGDGVGDVLLVDVKLDDEGNVLSVTDSREGRYDFLEDSHAPGSVYPDESDMGYDDGDDDAVDDIIGEITGDSSYDGDSLVASNMDYDYSADTTLDPDAFIDNAVDTTDMV